MAGPPTGSDNPVDQFNSGLDAILKALEQTASQLGDALRPKGYLPYDVGRGVLEGSYDFVKGLLLGLTGIVSFYIKFEWQRDPATTKQVVDALTRIILMEKVFLEGKGTPALRAKLLKDIQTFATDLAKRIRVTLTAEWKQAVKEGKQAEFLSRMITYWTLNIWTAGKSLGELRAATGSTLRFTRKLLTTKLTRRRLLRVAVRARRLRIATQTAIINARPLESVQEVVGRIIPKKELKATALSLDQAGGGTGTGLSMTRTVDGITVPCEGTVVVVKDTPHLEPSPQPPTTTDLTPGTPQPAEPAPPKLLQGEVEERIATGKAKKLAAQLEKDWARFDEANNTEFKQTLREFRGNDDQTMVKKGLTGGEGQLFLSQKVTGRALKRWFKTRIADFGPSVKALEDAWILVESNPALQKVLTVVRTYGKGTDWILRDFDESSIPLKDALGDPAADAARQEAINILTGSTDPAAQNILRMLENNSANIHWSPELGKLLVIDTQ